MALSALAGGAEAALLKSYDFEDSFQDTLGNGAALTSFGGSITGGRYVYGANQGLRLSDALADVDSYGIEIGLRTSEVTAWNKLIDFKERVADNGFYIYQERLHFFGPGVTGGEVTADTDFVIGVAREADTLSLYLNGEKVGERGDPGETGVSPSNVLFFLMDDTRTANEAAGGSLDFIRIHEGADSFGEGPDVEPTPTPAPVPLPASAPMLLAGIAGLLGLRRASRRAG